MLYDIASVGFVRFSSRLDEQYYPLLLLSFFYHFYHLICKYHTLYSLVPNYWIHIYSEFQQIEQSSQQLNNKNVSKIISVFDIIAGSKAQLRGRAFETPINSPSMGSENISHHCKHVGTIHYLAWCHLLEYPVSPLDSQIFCGLVNPWLVNCVQNSLSADISLSCLWILFSYSNGI